jgi:hypothetical protein
MAGYNYTGFKIWSFGASASYNDATSISNVVGGYGSINGTLMAARQLGHFTHLTCSMNAVQYHSSSFGNYNQLTYVATFGLAFAPKNIPLRIW